jgi:Double zinc ribbon/Adenylate and Guanylate cyclase catalytic domain
MRCPRCDADTPDGTRFCIECGASLTPRCPRYGADILPRAKFCGECGTPLTAQRSVPPSAPPPLPLSYIPGHLAEKILTSKAALEGERKQVTVLFADLKGSMELLADRDPEDARAMLDPVLECMMAAVHRYEGTVNQVMGDGIMALFGAPITHEGHAVRAVLAARIDRRPAEDKRLLRTAAVLGTDVYWPLLQAIAELPEEALHRGLAHLQAAEFLYETRLFPEREYTFKHALTHEVAYNSLLLERRQVLHARIVEALEALAGERVAEPVDRLAHHALQGEVWAKAVPYCQQAGARAWDRAALSAAIDLYGSMEMTFWLPQAEAALAQVEGR